MGGRLKMHGAWVLVSVLDLEEGIETAPDGTRFRFAIDPSTGLAMAPDEIHAPAGVIAQLSEEAEGLTGLVAGKRIIIQRDLGGQFEHEGMTVQAFKVGDDCPGCGRRYYNCSVVAEATRERYAEHWGPWTCHVGRIVVTRTEVSQPHVLDVLGVADKSAVRWGTVTGYDRTLEDGRPEHGDVVAYVQGPGVVEWNDGGVAYASLPLPRSCRACGHPLQEGCVLAHMPYISRMTIYSLRATPPPDPPKMTGGTRHGKNLPHF